MDELDPRLGGGFFFPTPLRSPVWRHWFDRAPSARSLSPC